MSNEKKSDFWIVDPKTLNELQTLKTFINFVVSLKYATEMEHLLVLLRNKRVTAFSIHEI